MTPVLEGQLSKIRPFPVKKGGQMGSRWVYIGALARGNWGVHLARDWSDTATGLHHERNYEMEVYIGV